MQTYTNWYSFQEFHYFRDFQGSTNYHPKGRRPVEFQVFRIGTIAEVICTAILVCSAGGVTERMPLAKRQVVLFCFV